MLEMNYAEYAKHRGVSRQAISKAIASERIPKTCIRTRPSGAKVIDVAAADLALGQTQSRINEPAPSNANFADSAAAAGEGEGAAAAPASDAPGLTKARTETEQYRARLAQLEYEQRIGRLVSIEDVTLSMERCAEVLVRDIDQLPAEADDLAAAFARDGAAGLRVALKETARRIRGRIAENMRLIGKADQDQTPETES